MFDPIPCRDPLPSLDTFLNKLLREELHCAPIEKHTVAHTVITYAAQGISQNLRLNASAAKNMAIFLNNAKRLDTSFLKSPSFKYCIWGCQFRKGFM